MSKKYYAVQKGRKVGVFDTWDECKEQVLGFPEAKYKSFKVYEEAVAFSKGEEYLGKIMESEEVFKKLKDEEIIGYVDGSFSDLEEQYSYGVVLINNKNIEEYNGIGKYEDFISMRNVAGELEGAMRAMEISIENGYKKLYLHYDYTGIEKWALGEWKTNKEGTKFYKSYYDSIKDKLEVVFIKVPAHEGYKYNELADELAKKAFQD